MFEAFKDKVRGIIKKFRKAVGKPAVWGTAALLSPALVACYGPVYDDDWNCDLSTAECLDGYINLMSNDPACRVVHTEFTCTENDTESDMMSKACVEYSCLYPIQKEEAQAPSVQEEAPSIEEELDMSCASDDSCENDCNASSSEVCNSACVNEYGYYKWNNNIKAVQYVACVDGEVCVKNENGSECVDDSVQNE